MTDFENPETVLEMEMVELKRCVDIIRQLKNITITQQDRIEILDVTGKLFDFYMRTKGSKDGQI